MRISEVAKLTGITVRTLHYYDEIGLLKPSEITEAGYRLYSREDLEILQQILFFRELDFPLSQIKEIMNNPNYDKEEALKKQKELLIQQRQRIEGLIKLIEKRIEGDNNMSFKEFDMNEIEENKKKYAKEVKERWGTSKAYEESEKKTSSYNKEKWGDINQETSEIFKGFAELRNSDPGSEEVQELVRRWQKYITDNFYTCTNEILSGLGLMYVEDERFKENLDKNGEGTAKLMEEAIKIYCSK
ncbi:MAG: MerR family transcriptional regulator [Clostridium saudiense]|uniref:MerR family transcriptional regulator n=1 Tax=Clostridium saudiense TaxID=1414720 RepID=UPI002913AF8F|nr:MerR family transcriptional regulator [Clostridium saudiense]MDU3523024.1 MerR family transcriptional regulator [Clostridium saudiense]